MFNLQNELSFKNVVKNANARLETHGKQELL